MELVYDAVLRIAIGLHKVQGLKMTVTGEEHIPEVGGAVIPMNHIGYFDFTYGGYPPFRRGHRRIRYMAKKEVFDANPSGWLMRQMGHIPVDREAGANSYKAAVEALKNGELVGVFPEATISRSFELKEFKSGAARMAIESKTPIIPTVLWGSQRVWTKDHSNWKKRVNVPITIATCPPIEPTGTPEELTKRYRAVMHKKLMEVQRDYGDHPVGEFWVPQRLGGGAPSIEEARMIEEKSAEERRARRAAKLTESDK